MSEGRTVTDALGRLVDKCENLLGALQLPLKPEIHVAGIKPSLKEIRDEIKRIYFQAGGEDVWQ